MVLRSNHHFYIGSQASHQPNYQLYIKINFSRNTFLHLFQQLKIVFMDSTYDWLCKCLINA